MKYALLIYGDESAGVQATPDQQKQMFDEYSAYEEEIGKKGAKLAGEALQPTPTATSVRVKDGKPVTTDGPFAETKEQLGGFYLVEAKDLDEAIEWGAKCPGAKYGTIEVRPVMEFEQP